MAGVLNFEWPSTAERHMQEEYNKLGSDALYMSHYELAQKTDVHDPIAWRQFMLDPRVYDYAEQELRILRRTELRKLLKNVNSSRSVGQAQLINALQKLEDAESITEGPVFVYCYIPLAPREAGNDNVLTLQNDPFRRG
jgi:hypothetical protein